LDYSAKGGEFMDTQTQSTRGGGGNNRQVAVAVMDLPEKPRMRPVWFFIGAILMVYGFLILATGLYELGHPPSTVLASLHAPIWWGAILAAAGGIFLGKFCPRSR
jgi:hypothetical protein